MAKEIDIEINVKAKGAEKNLQKVGVGLKGIQAGAKAAGKAMFSFTNILKGAVVVRAFDAVLSVLKETFMSNQRVVDSLNTATTSLKFAFNDFFNLIFGNTENMSKFGQELIRNLQEPFINSLRALQAFSKSFLAFIGFQFGAATAQAAIGLAYFNEAVGENNENIELLTSSLSDYSKGILDTAKNLVELNNLNKIARAQNAGIIEDYDRQAEIQRQLRDDTRLTVEERIVANEKLGELLKEQQTLMEENAKIAVAAAEAQLALDKNNIDFQVAKIEAENELAAVKARVTGLTSEQLTNQAALEKELIDLKTSEAQGIQEVAQN